MYSSLYFQISSLVYIILLIVVYFSRKRLNIFETKIYSYLIIINFVGVILDLISTYLAIVDVTNPLLNPVSKLYLVYLITWMYVFTIYLSYISTKNKKINVLDKKYRSLLYIFYLVPVIVIMLCPLYNYSNDGIVYTYGLSANLTYGFSGLYICFWLLCLIYNRKELKSKKYIPLFILIVLGVITAIMQSLMPQLLLITSLFVYVTVLMYFTIENPDVKMIEQLDIAKTNAEKANKAKSDFLSSMSHEIRTPLNAIVGFSECIMQESDIEDIHRDAKDVIMASQNLLEIVNGILDISKIEANKMEIVETDYELLPALENISKLMIPRIGEKPIELKTNFAVDIPYKMHGDIGKIKQIVTNILTNAVKYTERGQINFDVNCVNENNISSLVISVEDTGRGIEADKIDKLFTKFNRLDEDRNTTIEGTGLGLAITKNLVDMLGGKIIVQSKYGEGSKFTVYLKQNIVSQDCNEEEKTKEEKYDLSFEGHKILIVDDNKLNLRVADKLLKNYSLSTTLVESGMECINKIKANEKYDLILLDDMMPRMSGIETLARLKQLPNFNIPTIALTANAISGEREKYINAGFDEYLAKPIEKIELEKVLYKFLNKGKISINSSTKALIVDDNKINIKVAENFLKPYEFNVDSVLSGNECIEKLKTDKYDMIFMDDMMPNLSGVETLQKLKEDENFDVPVIALTANAISGAREHYLSLGFNEYISKPIDKKELDRVVNMFTPDENTEEKTNIEEVKETETKEVTEVENGLEETKTTVEVKEEDKIDYLKNNGVDINTALSLLGDMEMYNETLEDFKNNFNEKIIKLKRFKEANDMQNYAILVHSLKSDCKYLGFTKLAEISYEHELKSKANDSEFVTNNFENLVKECAKVKVIIDKY